MGWPGRNRRVAASSARHVERILLVQHVRRPRSEQITLRSRVDGVRFCSVRTAKLRILHSRRQASCGLRSWYRRSLFPEGTRHVKLGDRLSREVARNKIHIEVDTNERLLHPKAYRRCAHRNSVASKNREQMISSNASTRMA